MRSFNYVRARFADGDDFVSDAPDAIARDVATLLDDLPPLGTRGLEVGALAVPGGLGALVHLRAGRRGARPAFVHALVLAGSPQPEALQAARALLLSRYGHDEAEAVATLRPLLARLAGLDLRLAAGSLTARFVDAAQLEGIEAARPAAHVGYWRHRRSRRRRGAARAGGRAAGDASAAARTARGRSLPALPALRGTATAVRAGADVLRRLPGRLLRRGADALAAGARPWILLGTSWVAGAFLLGVGLASRPADPPAAPSPAALPAVSSGVPGLAGATCSREGALADAADRALAGDLLAAIERLEALEVARRQRAAAGDPTAAATNLDPWAATIAAATNLDPRAATIAAATTPDPWAATTAAAAGQGAAPEPADARADDAPAERLPRVATAATRKQDPAAAERQPRASAVGRYARVDADFLFVRAGPGTDFPKLARLRGGTPVRASRSEHDGWTRIGEPTSGWVASQYLSAWSKDAR